MHALMNFICDELQEYEEKTAQGKPLSTQDVQIIGDLTEIKKNILKIEKLENEEYSNDGSYRGSYGRGSYMGRSYDGGSYARGRGRNAARDSMGRYSSDGASFEDGYSRAEEDLATKLKSKISSAPDERTRRILQDLMNEIQ